MMISELRRERQAIIDKMTALVDRADRQSRELSPEEEREFRRMEAQVISLDERVRGHLRLELARRMM